MSAPLGGDSDRAGRPDRTGATSADLRAHTDSAPCHVVDATMFWSATGGGVRRYLITKQAWLATQPGWTHTIAAPLGATTRPTTGTDAADLRIVDIPGMALPGSGGYRLPLRRSAIADRLAALQPDLIEAGDPYVVAWAAVDAARRRGAPAVAYCHSNLEQMARMAVGGRAAGAAGRAARAYAARVYRRFDRVLAPSDTMRRHLVDWGVGHVATQPLGVDTHVFRPERADPAWRVRLGLAPRSRLLVFAGRFAPEKHLDVLAKAVDRLGPPYTLLVIGAGPRPPRGDRVRILPFVAGVEALAIALASADAFVHAGDQETFGLSVLEAMACGLPVVARRAEGLAELVDASVGVPVESAAPEAYAEAIAALFATDLDPLRQAARQRAEANDWRAVLPRLLAQYRSLLPSAAEGTAPGVPPAAGTPAPAAPIATALTSPAQTPLARRAVS